MGEDSPVVDGDSCGLVVLDESMGHLEQVKVNSVCGEWVKTRERRKTAVTLFF